MVTEVDDLMSKQHTLAYWVDLQPIQFEESKPDASWLQAFPIGEYKHPVYGKIVMSFERAKAMASNVIKKVRGIDIAIDYGHDSGGIAAGWVSSAEARSDGLWLFVEWTADAANDIRSGKFRYFSPEFVDEWEHPQSGKKFKDVLLGGGLTNRPFLKNIMPVNLSEVLEEETSASRQLEGGEMEKLLTALREQFKLSEDASEDEILEAFTKALQAPNEEDPPAGGVASLNETEVAKILEEHPALGAILEANQQLAEENKTLAGRVVNLEITARKSGVSAKLSEWHAGGPEHKHGLPVALDEKVEAFMLSINERQATAFSAILDELIKTGLTPLSESKVGKVRKESDSNTSALSKVEAGIKALMDADEGLTFADASTEFFRDNEDLYAEYLAEMMDEEVDA